MLVFCSHRPCFFFFFFTHMTYRLGGVKGGERVHRRIFLGVELLLGSAAQDVGVALVESEANLAVDLLSFGQIVQHTIVGTKGLYPLLRKVETGCGQVSLGSILPSEEKRWLTLQKRALGAEIEPVVEQFGPLLAQVVA